ncbi:MAG: HlyD family efflux transporter periplasmic adaptor subunit [Sulfuricella denitrificans]|nr:HlyD family efflux transporter periplasmic adaptor subunit [Sulfuricella denitrificans]
MRFRVNPQQKSATNEATTGRKRRLAKITLALLLGGTVMYAIAVPPANVRVEGLLHGDLIPVSPLYRAQITQQLTHCYSKVKAGEPLVMVSNFILDEQYASDYQTRQTSLHLERINQNEGAAAAAMEVQMAQQSYRAAASSADKARALSQAYDELHDARAIGRVARDAARSDLQRANAESAALKEAWNRSRMNLAQIKKGSVEKVASLEQQLNLIDDARKRVSTQPILSPASGQVLDCTAFPNAVVEAGTPIYRIFDIDRAYVMVFTDPSEISSLSVGMPAYISIPGVSKTLPGHITALTPEASRLPESLTRYFWQHNQWSQYRPVKIALDNLAGLDPALREKLIYDARVQVRIPVSSWGEWLWGKS